jgi:hypothetical protein
MFWILLEERPFVDYLAPTEWSSFHDLQWPIEKTRQVSYDALQAEYGMIEWKRTLTDLEKCLDVAYQDALGSKWDTIHPL